MKPLTEEEYFWAKTRQMFDSINGKDPEPMPVPVSVFYCIRRECSACGERLTLPWRDCGNPACSSCKRGGGHYPCCPVCGFTMREETSAPNVIWTGALTDRYRSKENESYGKGDGFWAWKRKSSLSGKPEPVFLNDWQSVASYAKAEGCADPRSIGNNMEPTETGKGLKNPIGLPGCEV